nr:hypothetical protein [Flavobacterium sp. ASV13]
MNAHINLDLGITAA